MTTYASKSQAVSTPISIRLNPDVRETLQAEAKTLGIGLASYLRQMAAKAARDATRARLRAGSAAVATHIAEDRSARNFMGEWGTPGAEG